MLIILSHSGKGTQFILIPWLYYYGPTQIYRRIEHFHISKAFLWCGMLKFTFLHVISNHNQFNTINWWERGHKQYYMNRQELDWHRKSPVDCITHTCLYLWQHDWMWFSKELCLVSGSHHCGKPFLKSLQKTSTYLTLLDQSPFQSLFFVWLLFLF